jgi:hypothetical protein
MAIHGNTNRYPIKPIPAPNDRPLVWDTLAQETVQVEMESFNGLGVTNQNNIRRMITTELVTDQFYNVHTLINNSQIIPFIEDATNFELTEQETLIVRVPVSNASGSRYIWFDYYLLLNNGAGTYGIGGDIVVDEDDFLFIRSSQQIELQTDFAEPPILYTLTSNNINNPAAAVNAFNAAYPITNNRDYYFQIFKNFSADTINNPFSIYRFIGNEGEYGSQGVDTAVSGDFLLVELNEVTVPQGFRVIDIVVGSIIDPTITANDNILKAIQRSFRGQINISTDDLYIFEAQKKEGNKIFLEKYYWTAGRMNDIATNATINNFYLDLKLQQASLDGENQNGATSLYSVHTEDVSNPHLAVNSSSNSFIIDSSITDSYFMVYKNNVREKEYNLYRFIGANGTYGDGNTQAILGDFELVTAFDSSNIVQSAPLTFKTIVVGAVINGTGIANDDISKAVNRSFRGIININSNEIVLFQVQRKVASANSFTIYNEQYYWTSGEGQINSNSELSDFELDYSLPILSTTTYSKGFDPKVIAVETSNVDSPASPVNAITDTVVVSDDDYDVYFILYNENVNSKEYKIYKFDGADGEYGVGGDSTAVNGDFDVVEKITPEEQILIKTSQLINNGDGTSPFVTEAQGFNKVKVEISAAQISTIGSAPIELIPSQGAGKTITILDVAVRNIYNGTAFNFAEGLKIFYNADTNKIAQRLIEIDFSVSSIKEVSKFGASNKDIFPNSAIMISSETSKDAALANSSLEIAITYTVYDLEGFMV